MPDSVPAAARKRVPLWVFLALIILLLIGGGIWRAGRFEAARQLTLPASPTHDITMARPVAPAPKEDIPAPMAMLQPTPDIAVAPPPPATDLEQRLEETAALVAAQTATITKLETMVEASLKAPPPAPITSGAQLMYLLWNLKDRADSGQPFVDEMDALREEVKSTEHSTHMERLAAHARSGVPSLTALREAFQHSIPAILRDAHPLPADAGAKEKLRYWLSHAVTIRRVDVPSGEVSVDAAIAGIETALRDGNIEQAEKHAATLEKSGNNTIAPWLSQARDTLEVRQAINGLREAFHALSAAQKTENAP